MELIVGFVLRKFNWEVFFFAMIFVATQLARQFHQERLQVVCSKKVRNLLHFGN